VTRLAIVACLFAIGLLATLSADATAPLAAQEKRKQPKGKFDPPKLHKPDAATLKTIAEKSEQLRNAVAALKEKKLRDDVLIEVEIYLKAAENIVRFEEWFHANSGKWALTTLDQGLERAKQAADGKAVWRDAPGKWMLRAYRSQIDGSIQPYAVLLPHDYGRDPTKKWRLDVVLHGRDSSLTEAKFIATHNGTAPKDRDYIQLEPYGRGNNAYRWAGETDVDEVWGRTVYGSDYKIDKNRVVLRGFSMGGAGTWHIGLHHPSHFCVIGPGAGFTTTHGYITNLPAKLPDYQEKCLHIYDAVDYAENAFNVPIVAYSGEKDAQKKAADNIEKLLKDFKEQVKFTHIVAPGLEHQMPKEWQDKAEIQYRKFADNGRDPDPERIRFVTYTPMFWECGWVSVDGLETTYQRAVIDVRREGNVFTGTSSNIRSVWLLRKFAKQPAEVVLDGDTVIVPADEAVVLLRSAGKWILYPPSDPRIPVKSRAMAGPIDAAFRWAFEVTPPSGPGWHPVTQRYTTGAVNTFAALWDKYFRGALPMEGASQVADRDRNRVLFGDPQSNPKIAEILPHLPITWTKEKLVVNGVTYDPATHVPVLIYPDSKNTNRNYVVINSGHTFKEADLKGTNALLYPRLGDWAVIKPTPTEKDPAAYEVVAAGLFDENWQFTGPVAPDAKLEKLWGEGEFTEGPAEGPDGCVYFSDIGNRIMKFDPKTGKTTEFRNPGGRSNGLKFDGKGRLVACEGANTGGNRRISVTEKDGTVKTLADKFDGKRFNSPNDLCIDAKGRIYFSDPRYVGDETREIDHESVYRIDPDGTVALVVHDVKKPNGLVIAPDGKTLYVAESNGGPNGERKLLAYPLNVDGSCGKRKEVYDFGAGRGIDGMTVTTDGVIVAAAGSKDAAGVYFIGPDGKKLGFVATPEDPSNCCFAGADRKTLYVTAGKSLYRVKLRVAGTK